MMGMYITPDSSWRKSTFNCALASNVSFQLRTSQIVTKQQCQELGFDIIEIQFLTKMNRRTYFGSSFCRSLNEICQFRPFLFGVENGFKNPLGFLY